MIKAILFAQCLACLLFLGHKGTERLQKGTYWFPLQDLARVTFILILSSTVLLLSGDKNSLVDTSFYDFVATVASDFFGGFFLKKAYATMASPVVIFITQLMYPFMCLVQRFILGNKNDVSIMQILSFISIVVICGLINLKTTHSKRGNILLGSVLALCSNACYIFNIIWQGRIVQKSGPMLYLRTMALYSLILIPALGVLTEYTNIPRSFKQIKLFYRSNYKWLLACASAFSLFYICGTFFIHSYGGTAFNLATLSTSIHFGLYNMIFQFQPVITAGYLVALALSILLLWAEMRN